MEKVPQGLIQPERQSISWEVFWQKAEDALAELKNVNNSDEAHISFVQKMHEAFTVKDANVFSNFAINEWERFRGALHAQYYDLPKVDEFILYVGELVKQELED